MKRAYKRILTVLLCLVLCLGAFPVGALTAGYETEIINLEAPPVPDEEPDAKPRDLGKIQFVE